MAIKHPPEFERLRKECNKRGLPTSVEVLLRHEAANYKAIIAALRNSNANLRRKLREYDETP